MPIEELLRDRYGLTLDEAPEAIPEGMHSRAWRVRAQGERFIAKLASTRVTSLERQQNTADLFDYLRARDVRAPEVVRGRDGEGIQVHRTEANTFGLMLMRHETLERIPATPADIRRVGAAIGAMHNALGGYPHAGFREPEFAVGQKDSPGAYTLHEGSRSRARGAVELETKMVAYVEASLPDVDQQSRCLLHSDLSLPHMGLLPDGSIYVFDFGDAAWGPVAFDLGTFLHHLYALEKVSFDKWRRLRSSVMEGYCSVAPLTREDAAAVDPYVVNRMLGQTMYIAGLAIEARGTWDEWPPPKTYKLAGHLVAHAQVQG